MYEILKASCEQNLKLIMNSILKLNEVINMQVLILGTNSTHSRFNVFTYKIISGTEVIISVEI